VAQLALAHEVGELSKNCGVHFSLQEEDEEESLKMVITGGSSEL